MAARDPEVNVALRHTRSAIRKMRAAARSVEVAAGWWEDIDTLQHHDLRKAAEAMAELAATAERDMRESYPSRGQR